MTIISQLRRLRYFSRTTNTATIARVMSVNRYSPDLIPTTVTIVTPRVRQNVSQNLSRPISNSSAHDLIGQAVFDALLSVHDVVAIHVTH